MIAVYISQQNKLIYKKIKFFLQREITLNIKTISYTY